MELCSLDDLDARIAALCAGASRTILGLTGAPGAGKSTLAHILAARRPGRTAVVPMDGFHLANSELRRLGRADRKGAEDTFDGAGYAALIRRLRHQPSDEIVYAAEFRREIEEPVAGAIAVHPDDSLIITEGNYLLLDRRPWAALRPLIDSIWYIEPDPATRLERLIARHIHFGRDEAAARAWVERTDERNAALIAATRARADAIIRIPEIASG